MPDILLVDDDDNLRAMLCELLKKLGHTVREASNGGEALELYAKKRADVVLTDIVMPPPEGLETIYTLRHIDPKCRIIAMSGGGRLNATDYLQIAKKSGAQRVLQKPFSKDELSLAISQVMSLLL